MLFITHYLNEYLEKFMQFCTYIRTICNNVAKIILKYFNSFALCIVYCSRFV